MTKNSNNSKDPLNLKIFFIKLAAISIAIIFVINFLFNMMFAERLEKIDKILSISEPADRYELKEKLKKEINKGLNKEELINEEDKVLLYKLYLKLKKEFEDLDKNKN